jgi:VanZ family protein
MNLARFSKPIFWTAMVFAFVMAILPQPPELPGQPNDKVQHMLAFATLAALGAWAYAGTALWRLLAGLSFFGAFIEFAQAIPAIHRDSDIKDWIADTVAAAIVLLVIGFWQRRRRREGQPTP